MFTLNDIAQNWTYKVPDRMPFVNKNVQKAMDQLCDIGHLKKLAGGYYRLTKEGHDFKGFDEIRSHKERQIKLEEKQLKLTDAQIEQVENILKDYPEAKRQQQESVTSAKYSRRWAVAVTLIAFATLLIYLYATFIQKIPNHTH